MISNEVKERLLQRDWYVHCQTKQESDLLLQACDDAGITWAAMDSDGEVYFYTDEPCISARGFSWDSCGGDYCNSVLATNANSNNWRLSLTERPEDI